MTAARRIAAAIAALAALVMVAIAAAPSDSFALRATPQSPACSFRLADGILRLQVPELVAASGPLPGVAVITAADNSLAISDAVGDTVSCRGDVPTLYATHAIDVVPAAPGDSVELVLDLRRQALAPGAPDEGDASSEIELAAQLGDAGELAMALGAGPDFVSAGRIGDLAGLDLNAAEANPDVDVIVNPQARLRISSGDGGGVVSLAGGVGFTGPWTAPSTLAGGADNDLIVGGEATDIILGGDGADQMFGMGGNDLLSAGGTGPDLLDCGARRDVALASGPADTVRSCELRRRRLAPSEKRDFLGTRLENASIRELK
jgi:RTX calcium-binding nonapeptide repeat (4 copies)